MLIACASAVPMSEASRLRKVADRFREIEGRLDSLVARSPLASPRDIQQPLLQSAYVDGGSLPTATQQGLRQDPAVQGDSPAAESSPRSAKTRPQPRAVATNSGAWSGSHCLSASFGSQSCSSGGYSDPQQIHTEANREGCSVDFDMCFIFPAPYLLEELKTSLAEANLDPHIRQYRERRCAEVEKKDASDNQFLEEYLPALLQWKEDADGLQTEARHRCPSKNKLPSYIIKTAPMEERLDSLFQGFVIEKKDREAFRSPDQLKGIQDARHAALSLLMSFFKDTDKFVTYLFLSQDKDELFLCVRMTDEAAAEHCETSSDNAEVEHSQIKQSLGVDIRGVEHFRCYGKFTQYLDKMGIYKKHACEAAVEEGREEDKVRFRKSNRVRLLYDSVTDVLDIDAMVQWRVLLAFYPLHTLSELKKHRKHYGRLKFRQDWWFEPPLDMIEHYFGADVAMYFLFGAEVCKALCLLIVISSFVTVYIAATQAETVYKALSGFMWGAEYPYARAVFGGICIIWTQYLEYRLNCRVADKMSEWGQAAYFGHSDIKNREASGYRGYLQESEVDHSVIELGVSFEEVQRGYIWSRLSTVGYAIFTIFSIVSLYVLATFLDNIGFPSGFHWVGYLVSITIKVLQTGWGSVAEEITHWEYHRFEIPFLDSWAEKTVVIQSICSFTGFFYVGFFMRHLGDCPNGHTDKPDCFGYLCHEMVIIFGIYIAFALKDVLTPLLTIWRKLRNERSAIVKGAYLDQADVTALSFLEFQAKWNDYDVTKQAEDYLQHIIPLAFVLLFGITFPLSPVLALISSVLQMHADAYTLTHSMKRPFPETSRGLGRWIGMIQIFSFIAVYTTVGLISFDMEPLKSKEKSTQFFAFFAFSTFAQLFRSGFSYFVPHQFSGQELLEKRQKRVMEVMAMVANRHHEGLHHTKKPPKEECCGQMLQHRQKHQKRWKNLTPKEMLVQLEESMEVHSFEASASGLLPNGLNVRNIEPMTQASPFYEAPPKFFGAKHLNGVHMGNIMASWGLNDA